MKTSELIKKLQKSLEKNGDVPVMFETYGPSIIPFVEVNCITGNSEEIYLFCGKGLSIDNEEVIK
jgi:hypothetical protein